VLGTSKGKKNPKGGSLRCLGRPSLANPTPRTMLSVEVLEGECKTKSGIQVSRVHLLTGCPLEYAKVEMERRRRSWEAKRLATTGNQTLKVVITPRRAGLLESYGKARVLLGA